MSGGPFCVRGRRWVAHVANIGGNHGQQFVRTSQRQMIPLRINVDYGYWSVVKEVFSVFCISFPSSRDFCREAARYGHSGNAGFGLGCVEGADSGTMRTNVLE